MTTSADDLIEHWAHLQCAIQGVEDACTLNLTRRVNDMFIQRLTFDRVLMDYMKEQMKCP